jgi:hypothetical protein
MVVGPHHQNNVFERHNQQQGPKNQGQNPQNMGFIDGQSLVSADGFFDGVKGAGSDIAVNNPDGAQQKGF